MLDRDIFYKVQKQKSESAINFADPATMIEANLMSKESYVHLPITNLPFFSHVEESIANSKLKFKIVLWE